MNLSNVKSQIDNYFADEKRVTRHFKEMFSKRTEWKKSRELVYQFRFIPKGKRFKEYFDSVNYHNEELLYEYIKHRGKPVSIEDYGSTHQWLNYEASSSSPFRSYYFSNTVYLA